MSFSISSGGRVVLALLILSLSSKLSWAQESPVYQTPILDYSESHRQSVCDRQAQLHNGTLELRNALSGLELRPALFVGNISSFLLQSSVIPEKDPGLIVEILDELAERGGFTWRNSFGIANLETMPQGTSFNQVMIWSMRTYDLSATLWSQTLERINLGASFPEGWFDASIIMVGEKEESESELDVWAFLEPFTAGVWCMIAVTIVVSGLIYWWMERYNQDSDRQELGGRPTEPVFFAALSFTGDISFQPSTDYARLFVVSLAFLCLLICSIYTANLASFLVVKNTPSIRIESVGDAVNAGMTMCTVRLTAAELLVMNEHPGAKLVRLDTEEEPFLGVRNGLCDVAITSVASWSRFRGQSSVNGDCSLAWIGRVFRFLNGGFTTQSDSGTLCTSLVRDALNLHLLEMNQDGFMEKAWEREVERSSDINCDAKDTSVEREDGSVRLGLQDTGGLFIIHYSVAAVAIILAIFSKRKFREGQLCQCAKASQESHVNGNKVQSKCDSEPVMSLTDSTNAGHCVSMNHESELEAMYEKQCEDIAKLLTNLQSIQEQSRTMGEMIRRGNADASESHTQ